MADEPGSRGVITGEVKPEGGGLPVHATQFQIVLDTSDLSIIFIGRSIDYRENLQPTTSYRVVASVSLSHIMAKDLVKVLQRAIAEFEANFGPIPDLKPLELTPPNAP